MRSLPWTERFDRVLCWFTSFGYFGDDENRHVLGEAFRALRPGGLFAVELNNLLRLLQVYADETVTERGEDKMIDRHRFDIQTNRSLDERTIVRGGKRRTFEFSVRMFSPAELRDWFLAAGFREAVAYGDDGEPLTPEHEGRRMTVVGQK
jgi:SAM-dependent methyltransferase